ncbi:hypothetical protein LY76DRAFT_383126 [Colletotrichum caudatum]|nr:hypothetical protein LY76DRAFT_383126 [Colletotrichum caudatum]
MGSDPTADHNRRLSALISPSIFTYLVCLFLPGGKTEQELCVVSLGHVRFPVGGRTLLAGGQHLTFPCITFAHTHSLSLTLASGGRRAHLAVQKYKNGVIWYGALGKSFASPGMAFVPNLQTKRRRRKRRRSF